MVNARTVLVTILACWFLTACTVPLPASGGIEVTITAYPTKVIPGDQFEVELSTDATELEVNLVTPDGVEVAERVEGANVVLTITVLPDAETGERIVTAQMIDRSRYAEVSLGFTVTE